MNLTLELTNDKNINISCELIREFWKSHNNYIQEFEESFNDLKEWTKEGHKLYLIKLEKEYIGFAHLGSRGANIDWLEDLFILSTYQNKGYGSSVIEILEEEVKKYSESLYIEVAARNLDALNLYRKLGYDCLNTITIRKDFNKEKFEKISSEKINNMQFEIKKYK